jgi:hypothetical protein
LRFAGCIDPAEVPWVRQSATGSCARCGRALDLASVKLGGVWFGRAACARDGACPLGDERALRTDSLINRPHRAYGRRAPKELRRTPA